MLILRAFKVVKGRRGDRLRHFGVLCQWEINELKDLNFDFLNASEWRKLLGRLKSLPRFTEKGEPLCFQVFFQEPPLYIKTYFEKKGIQDELLVCFPGYDSNGHNLNLIENGQLK